MILSEEERFKHYDLNVFLGNPSNAADGERYPYHRMRLKEPMFDALCYAYGYKDYPSTAVAFNEPAETFREQLANIKKRQTRHPKTVLDVGSGRGELTATLLYDGVECYAIDPSLGAKDITPMTFSNWVGAGLEAFFVNKSFSAALDELEDIQYDTIIFCESVEHIREEEFTKAYEAAVNTLRETKGMLIVTNWVGFHPINPDGGGWDHIRRIDDSVYDTLCSKAEKTVYRRGSHLVLRF